MSATEARQSWPSAPAGDPQAQVYRNPVTHRLTGTPPVSVAPMMDWTDRHYRFFARQLSPHALLYTEMVAANACIHGDRDYLLGFHAVEHPIAVQLGGDDPKLIAEAARIASDYGYDEINLNIGCPSERVQLGNFGACLMADPDLVARLVASIRAVTDLPVTVKHRIGIRGRESYEDMRHFVDTVASAGPARFTVHARIAILEGLSPKDNRTVPPLRYQDVYRLKSERPGLEIELNGGVKTAEQVVAHLGALDGVMLGRVAYENPVELARIESALYGTSVDIVTRRSVIEAMAEYVDRHEASGGLPRHVFRHMLHLFAGRPGSRHFRRVLSDMREGGHRRGSASAGAELLIAAVERIPSDVLDEAIIFPHPLTGIEKSI